MFRARIIVALPAIAALATSALVSAPSPADAATCPASAITQDIDRDGRADLVAGDPYSDNRLGTVEIIEHDGTRTTIKRSQLPGDPGEGSHFGQSVQLADLNADGCVDLAVGAPLDGYREPDDDVEDPDADPGTPADPKVFVLWGTATGPSTTDVTVLRNPGGESDGFADELAVLRPPGARPKLVAGMQYRADSRGGVALFTFGDDGTAGTPIVIDRDTPGVDGSAQEGSYFGSSIATVGNSIVVGSHGTTVGGDTRAGAITMLTGADSSWSSVTGKSYSQDSANVPGGGEKEDAFGFAVAAMPDWVAVGVPEEDLGDDPNAGAVQLFRWNASTRTLTPGAMVHQDSAGIPGSGEYYDRFGDAVGLGVGYTTTGRAALAVAVPGEEESSGPDDHGSWTVVDLGALTGTRYSLNSPGIPGADARNAGFQLHFSTLPGTGSGSSRRDALVVAMPSKAHGRVLVGPSWRGTWQSLEGIDYDASEIFGLGVS